MEASILDDLCYETQTVVQRYGQRMHLLLKVVCFCTEAICMYQPMNLALQECRAQLSNASVAADNHLRPGRVVFVEKHGG